MRKLFSISFGTLSAIAIFFAIIFIMAFLPTAVSFPQTTSSSVHFSMNAWPEADTCYFLPGENVYYYAGLQAGPGFSLQGFNYVFSSSNQVGNFTGLSHNVDLGGVFSDTVLYGNSGFTYTANWVSNSDSGINYASLASYQYVNFQPVGDTMNIYSGASGVFWDSGSPVTDYCHDQKYFITIDRLRGDINGDGIVDGSDLKVYNDYLTYYPSGERLTLTGNNVGAGICLFSYPNLVDEYLMSLWLNHPDNSYVSWLGWGKPMSSIYAIPVGKIVPFTSARTGDQLSINTSAFAVGITGRLPDGKTWNNATLVNNGQAVVNLPAGISEIKVEAKSIDGVTGVEKNTQTPQSFSLQQNYPNPFNPATMISYSIPKTSQVTLKVYDILGRELATLVNEQKPAGSYEIKFDASQLASGTYIYIA